MAKICGRLEPKRFSKTIKHLHTEEVNMQLTRFFNRFLYLHIAYYDLLYYTLHTCL